MVERLEGILDRLNRGGEKMSSKQRQRSMWRRVEEGDVFGRLVALGPLASGDSGRTEALCECTCGSRSWKRTDALIGGATTRCERNCIDHVNSLIDSVPIERRLNCIDHYKETGTDLGYVPLVAGEPTLYPPGSPQKIELMRERYLAGKEIFHPVDAADFSDMPAGFLQPSEHFEPNDNNEESERWD